MPREYPPEVFLFLDNMGVQGFLPSHRKPYRIAEEKKIQTGTMLGLIIELTFKCYMQTRGAHLDIDNWCFTSRCFAFIPGEWNLCAQIRSSVLFGKINLTGGRFSCQFDKQRLRVRYSQNMWSEVWPADDCNLMPRTQLWWDSSCRSAVSANPFVGDLIMHTSASFKHMNKRFFFWHQSAQQKVAAVIMWQFREFCAMKEIFAFIAHHHCTWVWSVSAKNILVKIHERQFPQKKR